MRQLILLLGVLAVVCARQALAENLSEVRILIDVSGSMSQNDPENVRVAAMRLLTELLPKGSRAGVWLFAEEAKVLLPSAKVTVQWRRKALKKSALIHSRGQRTHIEQALREVIKAWRADSLVQKNIILLTDGVVDVSRDASQSRRSRQRILQQLLPRLSQLGVKVHTVALSDEADHELLQQLSAGSGGLYLKAERADQLQRIFLHLLESAAPPDSVPLTGNRFVVDESIEEVTLLLFRSQDGEAPRLIRPDGVEVQLQADSLGLKWRSENGFDLLTMEAPMLGEWQIVAAADPDNRAMVVTNLKLQVDAIAALMLPNIPFVLQAHLQSEGKRINKTDFLQMVEMSLQTKVDAVATESQILSRHKEGVYQLKKNLPDEGSYELSLIADGGTFARVWHQQVQLSWPLDIELKWDAEAKRYILNLRTKTEFRPLLASSPLLYQKGVDAAWLPRNLERLDEQVWQISVAAGVQLKVELSLKADPLRTVTLPLIEVPALPTSIEKPSVEKTVLEAEVAAEVVIQEPVEDTQSEQVNWLQVSLIVLLINFVLAVGFFFARRYWQAQSADIEWPELQGETT
ncbi:MAG: VWA domain-containing protein [Gammaproteobacteria bacterium]|nr:VWA domain-containing protein [Gammaproteobacteria bacterium]